MITRRRRSGIVTCLIACVVACLVPRMAAAQSDGWDGRVRVSVGGGIQRGSDTLAQAFTVQKNLEPAPITVGIDEKRATLFDGGIVVRAAGRFGIGFSASYTTHDTNANVSAQVPHPLFFNQPRPVSGTTPVSRTELAAHIAAVYIVPAGPVDLLLSGGPSVFSIDQTLVTDIAYAEAYPYDTATFTSATSAHAKKTAIGYHAGADVTWKATSHVGVGLMVRYARATATLSPAPGNTVQDNAGGIQAAAGLRLGF
jgi:hypothetical protein